MTDIAKRIEALESAAPDASVSDETLLLELSAFFATAPDPNDPDVQAILRIFDTARRRRDAAQGVTGNEQN